MSRNAGSSERSITRFVRRACCFLVPPRASPTRLSCSSRSTADRGCSVACRTPAGALSRSGVMARPRWRSSRRRRAASRRGRLAAARSGPSATGAFAPACVLVNQALTILQFRGQTGLSRARRRPTQLRPATGHSPGAARSDPSCHRRDQQDRRGVTPRRPSRYARDQHRGDSARGIWRPTVLSDPVRRRVPSPGG